VLPDAGEAADVAVVASPARPEGVEVDRGDAGGARAGDVGRQRVADVDDISGRDEVAGDGEGGFEDADVGLFGADDHRVDHGYIAYAARRQILGRMAVGVRHDRDGEPGALERCDRLEGAGGELAP
jgi:hypothetical protein